MRTSAFVLAIAVGASLAAVTCIPTLPRDDSLVSGPRVLAVRADPAEAKPNAPLTFRAFAVDVDGGLADAHVVWDFCTAPKPLTEDNVVSNACLEPASWSAVGGAGATTLATMPSQACALFGPDPPPGGFRPRDPDVTGGYYQPLRAALAGAPVTFDLARVRCNLANAGAAGAAAFAAAYVPNQNPHLLPLASPDGAPLGTAPVPAATRLHLTASWNASDAETYATFDVASQSVTPLREAMRVSWYATSGGFDTEATERAATDPATTTSNTWTAPSSPGVAHLYVVLRDSRGGTDFASYDVAVTSSP